MNVNAARCRITANSFGQPIAEEVTDPILSEYPNIIPSFSDFIEDERKRRSRRYSYNSYHTDALPLDRSKSHLSSPYRGWPENTISWGRRTSDRINDAMVKQGRIHRVDSNKFDGRPKSSPGTSRRPYKDENSSQGLRIGRKEQSGGRGSIKLIYKRPPAPDPPIDKVGQASLKSRVPQSLIIVLGKTTPTANTNSTHHTQNLVERVHRETSQPKLPSYYLGEFNDLHSNPDSSSCKVWSPSFSTVSNNNNECDNCGGYSRVDVGL